MLPPRQLCFRLSAADVGEDGMPFEGLCLTDAETVAFGELLHVLACGEESAVLAFGRLSGRAAAGAGAALAEIAADELAHERLLRRLRASVPAPTHDPAFRRAMRRFYSGLASSDIGQHLANIVALDSAVCTILSALLRRGHSLAREPVVAAVLSRIRADESRHVGLSRRLAVASAPRARLLDVAAETRHGLVDLLAARAVCFDRLEVDPALLFRRLSRPPLGLLT